MYENLSNTKNSKFIQYIKKTQGRVEINNNLSQKKVMRQTI
jgi:hypothetical protein